MNAKEKQFVLTLDYTDLLKAKVKIEHRHYKPLDGLPTD